MKLSSVLLILSALLVIIGTVGYLYQNGDPERIIRRNLPEIRATIERYLPRKETSPPPERERPPAATSVREHRKPALPDPENAAPRKPEAVPEEMKQALQNIASRPAPPLPVPAENGENPMTISLPGDTGAAPDIVYSWRDQNGVRHFTNTPPPETATDISKIIDRR
ncbi:hypothetical protein DENIS_2604 [Desulfonema ishimotonii]|uniref:DUF4124 domain-containing protein n=1 Tax=Desulfonema ishimotonii TaxID=45657 RepID=A0A401FXB3_9BACT|nr:DUF4124 domain-containing protein [Desulfonema ishimotonii]GBC61642.1 hypothetical protein DENIS_2604 [Desulfonema ishimotonii]